MGKWIVAAMVVCLSGCAQMASDDSPEVCMLTEPEVEMVEAPEATESKAPTNRTLQEYLAAAKANAEKKGVEFNEKRATSRFNKMDADGNGIVTREEQVAAFEAKQ
jgi:hypothetical protein